MKMKNVFDLMFRLFGDHPEFLDSVIAVETLREIISEEYKKEVDKRQIGRALKTMGFYQENMNVIQSPIVRRQSVYHITSRAFEAAKVKYVVNDIMED